MRRGRAGNRRDQRTGATETPSASACPPGLRRRACAGQDMAQTAVQAGMLAGMLAGILAGARLVALDKLRHKRTTSTASTH